MQERLASADQGASVGELMVGDVMLAGYVWRDAKGLRYFIVADELPSGRILDSIELSGSEREVAGPLAAWCRDLRRSAPRTPADMTDEDRVLLAVEDRAAPLSRFWKHPNWTWQPARYPREGKEELSASSSADATVALAGEAWNGNKKTYAIQLLEQSWKDHHDVKVGTALADYYRELGFYAAEAGVVDGLAALPGASADLVTRATRARSLAAKGSDGAKSKSLVEESAERPPEYVFDGQGAFQSRTRNTHFDELVHVARAVRGIEWVPDGGVLWRSAWFTFDESPEVVLARDDMSSHGMWEILNHEQNIHHEHAYGVSNLFLVAFWQPKTMLDLTHIGLHVEGESTDLEGFGNGVANILRMIAQPDQPATAFVYTYDTNETAGVFLREYVAQGRDDLATYVAADHLAQQGDGAAKQLLAEMMAADLPELSRETWTEKKRHVHADAAVFRAHRGEAAALELIKSPAFWARQPHDDIVDALTLFGMLGNRELFFAVYNASVKQWNDLAKVRWMNTDYLRELLLARGSALDTDTFAYLAGGLELKEATHALLQRGDARQAVLIHGKPVGEIDE
jgi:hypothetical protein